MKLIKRIKEWNEKADEQNIKSWQRHPRLNNCFVYGLAGFMMLGTIMLIAFIFVGYYLTREITIIQAILASVVIPFILVYVRWVLKYRKHIHSQAFPKVVS